MTMRPSAEQVVGTMLPTNREWFPFLPVVRSASASFEAARVITGHEPSRAAVAVWVPWWAVDSYGPRHGDSCQLAVDVRGTYTPTFVGYVDGVARRRRRRGRPDPTLPTVTTPMTSVTVGWFWTGTDGVTRRGQTMMTAEEAAQAGPPERYRQRMTDEYQQLWDDTKPITYFVLVNYAPFTVPSGATAVVWGSWAPGPEMNHGYDVPRAHRARITADTGSPKLPNVGPFTYTGSRPDNLRFEVDLNPGETARLILPHVLTVTAANIAARDYMPGYWYEVTASDVLAEAGRGRVGDEPWPAEPVPDRLARLNALAVQQGIPVASLSSDNPLLTEGGGITARPRDIDAQSLVELYRKTAATLGAYPTTDYGGRLTLKRLEDTPVRVTQVALGDPIPNTRREVVTLPRTIVPELPEAYTVADVVNRWTVNYAAPDPDDPTRVVESTYPIEWLDSVRRWGPHAETIDTEAYALDRPTLATVADNLITRLWRAGTALSEPAWRTTDPITLDARRVDELANSGTIRPPLEPGGSPAYEAWRLVDVTKRHGQLVRIRPPVPAIGNSYGVHPDDKFYRLRAGRVDLADNKVELELHLEPYEQAGVPGSTLAELATPADRTLAWWAIDPALTLGSLAQIDV